MSYIGIIYQIKTSITIVILLILEISPRYRHVGEHPVDLKIDELDPETPKSPMMKIEIQWVLYLICFIH